MSRRRPTVVDLAFGQPRIWDPFTGLRCPDRDLRPLLLAVDEMTVVLDGRRRHLRQAWQQAFDEMGVHASDPGRPLIVGHPSTWGHRRASSLADAGGRRAGQAPLTLLPRAVLIARSHADITVRRCAVVETTHLPEPPHDPARPRPAAWDVQIVRRHPQGWDIERSGVIEPGDREAEGLSIIDDAVEAVFVDGDDPREVAAATELVAAHAIAGRVVPVDRDLLVRLGRRTGGVADDAVPVADGPAMPAPDASRRRSRRVLAGAAAAAVVVVAVAFGVGWWQRDDPAPAAAEVAVGRATLSVPGNWRESGQDTPSGDTTDDPTTTRAVFVSADDGRRIIAVLTELRDGSTRQSVATSLRNRIDQRGDDVVTEFSADTRYAGRDVISYREAPASGSAIRWYVIVDDGLQVSIGCQAGTAAESVDRECAEAVRSVRVGQ
ncbi:type VII secretion-associated protein [Gordonia amicalis]|uniref:type VII secretion-associated protein n=1 Tax=Gordonia amicalis TaxID=89053 RepID=UPI0024BB35E8|nr:type VII secretion-associated protein [Gordonia amicalis]MDJ0452667.1 type VII secretion-associated protein [Gordonia amicalis]MDV7075271.1 type VII secretion-associated protein [Gordonia amicalis]